MSAGLTVNEDEAELVAVSDVVALSLTNNSYSYAPVVVNEFVANEQVTAAPADTPVPLGVEHSLVVAFVNELLPGASTIHQ